MEQPPAPFIHDFPLGHGGQIRKLEILFEVEVLIQLSQFPLGLFGVVGPFEELVYIIVIKIVLELDHLRRFDIDDHLIGGLRKVEVEPLEVFPIDDLHGSFIKIHIPRFLSHDDLAEVFYVNDGSRREKAYLDRR